MIQLKAIAFNPEEAKRLIPNPKYGSVENLRGVILYAMGGVSSIDEVLLLCGNRIWE
jgi:hypothetical protein